MKFEEALSKLEEAVGKLETGDVSLEEALELYSRGVELLKICTTHLNEAEQKVAILLKNQEASFEVGGSDEEF